jgi:hypothetical protein
VYVTVKECTYTTDNRYLGCPRLQILESHRVLQLNLIQLVLNVQHVCSEQCFTTQRPRQQERQDIDQLQDVLNHDDDGQFAINIYTLKMPHFTHDLLEFKDINVQHLLHAADDAHNANNTREYLLALC